MHPAAPTRWRKPASGKPAESLFLLVFSAIPGRGGGPLPLLTFVRARAVEPALRRALDELAALGWREPDLQGAKTVALETETDEVAREAMTRAQRDGFALIAYG